MPGRAPRVGRDRGARSCPSPSLPTGHGHSCSGAHRTGRRPAVRAPAGLALASGQEGQHPDWRVSAAWGQGAAEVTPRSCLPPSPCPGGHCKSAALGTTAFSSLFSSGLLHDPQKNSKILQPAESPSLDHCPTPTSRFPGGSPPPELISIRSDPLPGRCVPPGWRRHPQTEVHTAPVWKRSGRTSLHRSSQVDTGAGFTGARHAPCLGLTGGR